MEKIYNLMEEFMRYGNSCLMNTCKLLFIRQSVSKRRLTTFYAGVSIPVGNCFLHGKLLKVYLPRCSFHFINTAHKQATGITTTALACKQSRDWRVAKALMAAMFIAQRYQSEACSCKAAQHLSDKGEDRCGADTTVSQREMLHRRAAPT